MRRKVIERFTYEGDLREVFLVEISKDFNDDFDWTVQKGHHDC
jgi:hypothetical protein